MAGADGAGAWVVHHASPLDQVDGIGVEVGGSGPAGFIGGGGGRNAAARFSFLPTPLASWSEDVPVLVNRAFADELELVLGETLRATVDGAARSFDVAGIVDTFPTTDPERPLLILDQPTLGLLRVQGSQHDEEPRRVVDRRGRRAGRGHRRGAAAGPVRQR